MQDPSRQVIAKDQVLTIRVWAVDIPMGATEGPNPTKRPCIKEIAKSSKEEELQHIISMIQGKRPMKKRKTKLENIYVRRRPQTLTDGSTSFFVRSEHLHSNAPSQALLSYSSYGSSAVKTHNSEKAQ